MSEHVGDGVGVRMAARLRVMADGGSISISGDSIKVDKADAVTMLLTAATDYRGDDPLLISGRQLDAASEKNYEILKQDHVADYQKYFKRVDFDLGKTDAVYFATDARIDAMKNGNVDPQLVELVLSVWALFADQQFAARDACLQTFRGYGLMGLIRRGVRIII